ncbi:MAG: hypothetical protein CSA66_02390 [Proteobacteria bacterium]|nr:MAG: hypothetical protein CSA66_02390 [Pseudomonadota bacterium]
MEKFCPTCSRVYGVDIDRCDVDGDKLVILKEEPSLVGHVLDGKYTMLAKLGEGGMGSVYRAEQTSMGREVAIKVLRREYSQNRTAIKRFLREAKASSKLGHPNTITVYDFGQSNDGLLYLVMELLTGRPLSDILDDDGAMPVERAVHIIAQVCDSLSEAHVNGIYHRDLKPENIFIEQKAGNPDFVKVLDFGIAKMNGDDKEVSQATATGMICGTPSYMSPEQAMGQDIDGRSDIYALGILLYEMLTDEKPFDGDTPMEVMLKHINEPSPNIHERTQLVVPQGIQDTIDAMLAKKAPGRPIDCQEVKKRLIAGLKTPLAGPIVSTDDPTLAKRRREDSGERAASDEKTGLAPVVRTYTLDAVSIRPKRRMPWLGAAALLLLLGVGTGLYLWLSSGAPAATDPPAPAVTSVDSAGEVRAAAPAGPLPGGDEAGLADAAAESPDSATAVAAAGETAAGETMADEVVAVGSVTGDLVNTIAGGRALALGAASAPPGPEMVSLRLETRPPGANVYDADSVLLGESPLVLQREKGSPSVVLTLKKRFFHPRTVEFDTAGDIVKSFDLRRRRRPAGRDGATGKSDDGKMSSFGTF